MIFISGPLHRSALDQVVDGSPTTFFSCRPCSFRYHKIELSIFCVRELPFRINSDKRLFSIDFAESSKLFTRLCQDAHRALSESPVHGMRWDKSHRPFAGPLSQFLFNLRRMPMDKDVVGLQPRSLRKKENLRPCLFLHADAGLGIDDNILQVIILLHEGNSPINAPVG